MTYAILYTYTNKYDEVTKLYEVFNEDGEFIALTHINPIYVEHIPSCIVLRTLAVSKSQLASIEKSRKLSTYIA